MFKNNLWLISIRQSFLNLLAYFIMIGVTILLYQLLILFDYKSNVLYDLISRIVFLYAFTTPLIISTSLSYFLAKNFDLNRISIPTLTFLLFVTFYWEYKSEEEINININLNFLMIIIPLFAVFIYKKISDFDAFLIKLEVINEELKDVLKSIIPFIVTFLICGIFMKLFIDGSQYVLSLSFFKSYAFLPIELTAILSLSLSSFIWWFTGIHGTNLVISIFGEEYLKQVLVGNLDASTFINNFVIYGGDGATLSLLLAILFFSKNQFVRKIAFLSLPFAIFNINEIVLFALPIILNIRLLFPFIFVPLSNFLIGYIFLYFNPISLSDVTVSWITPIFISGYSIDNSFLYVLLQLVQLIVGVLIYLPFMKKYEKFLNENEAFENLKTSLGIKDHLEKTMHLNFIKTQQDIINEEKEIAKLVEELSQGEFLLYYQPKVDINKNSCSGYEALLRFKKGDRIVGPYFIDKIEQIGFEKIIDFWVINQLKKDLDKWKEKNFYPKVSINISPASICNENVVSKIIDDLKGYKVDIEVLERTFAQKMSLFIGNINRLKENGFTISIDDFGSGFSSLQYLNILPANTIKFDRTLILNTKTESGIKLYKSIASMCQTQGFEIVAEGVETDIEMEVIKDSKIEIVQGFYYSKAIPFDEIIDFEEKMSSEKEKVFC